MMVMAMVRRKVEVDQGEAHQNALIKNKTIALIAKTVLMGEDIVLHNHDHNHQKPSCAQQMSAIDQRYENQKADLYP
jgi:hypothetical protein